MTHPFCSEPAMIHSMTAFARADAHHASMTLAWEIRSVNHRYLEPSFKLPESLRHLEPAVRQRLRESVQRGKIECSLRQQQDGEPSGAIDEQALAQLLDNVQRIQARAACAPLNPLELLAWPGVLTQHGVDGDALTAAALAAFDAALSQLCEVRAREGGALRDLLLPMLARVDGVAAEVRRQLPTLVGAQQQRLRDRLAELKLDADPQRLEQELVILAQKSDVTEELDRLTTHVAEVRRTLGQGGPCGRRLDFLMQELHREANTLSSKSLATDTTQAAVELKVVIEQMREQIQNIE